MVGIEGFEPSVGDSESPALPLGDIPVKWADDSKNVSNGKFLDKKRSMGNPFLFQLNTFFKNHPNFLMQLFFYKRYHS